MTFNPNFNNSTQQIQTRQWEDEPDEASFRPNDYQPETKHDGPVLTDRQRMFVEHYLTYWHKSDAAEFVGYPHSQSIQRAEWLLSKPSVRAEIRRRLESQVMSANEVLTRLSAQARGNMGDFIRVTPDGPVFDFQKAEALGRLGNIKELKTRTKILTVASNRQSRNRNNQNVEEPEVNSAVLSVEVDLKLYDAQAALRLLGQSYNLFDSKKEVSGTVVMRIEYGNSGGDDVDENGEKEKTPPQYPNPLGLPGATRASDNGGNIYGRKVIPVRGINPLDDDDDEFDEEATEALVAALDLRQSPYGSDVDADEDDSIEASYEVQSDNDDYSADDVDDDTE